MEPRTACPPPERWRQHLKGTASPAEQAELTAHLDVCPACQKTLETLAAGGDSLLRQAQQLGEQSDRTEGAAASEEGSVTTAEPSPEAAAQLEEALDFLAPSAEPGHLGRLGHYEVLELIGQGGFGVVLKAFDEKLHRMVAIKVLSPQLASNGTARKRFAREAQAAAAVAHEHVVTIHAVEDEQNPPYLVMQLIAGVSLQHKIDKEGPLELREILRIGLQTAKGLAAAHDQGLVHRDIKPANILLENGVERVKITDFGLARAVDDASLTQSGVVAGTPMYMSPEQAGGLAVDHRSDLFSLGTVLYVMCTGRAPFRATSMMGVLKRVIKDTPRPIREISPEIPDWLADIIDKLHAKKPADRFQSAKEVAEVLSTKLAEVQMPGRASEAAPAARPTVVRRSRRKLAVALVLLLFAGIAGVIGFWPRDDSEPLDPRDDHGSRKPKDNRDGNKHPTMPPLALAPFDATRAKEHQQAWARHLGVADELTNSLGMKLRLIPPGEFMMGSTPEEVETFVKDVPEYAQPWVRSETPQRKTRIEQPYYLASCETTVGQFKLFAQEMSYRSQDEASGKGGTAFGTQLPEYTWRHPQVSISDQHPVSQVTLQDAEEFCHWLSKKEGRDYVIPTEEQWEFACRAGTTTPWYCPKESLSQHAWVDSTTSEPVGQKAANPFGFFDMHGNIEELTRGEKGYVARSGAGAASRIRSAYRVAQQRTESYRTHGFRVAIVGDLKAKTPPRTVSPFVILARGARAEEGFPTLHDAVEKAHSGDTIEIRGNGPFLSDRIAIEKALRLQAAKGSQPVIVFQHDPIPAPTGYVIKVSAPLAAEGIEFRYARPETGGVLQLFGVTSGLRLALAHCRIVTQGEANGIYLHRGIVEVDHSVMLGKTWNPLRWNFHGEGQMIVNHSLLAAPTTIVLHAKVKRDETPGLSIRINRSTVLGDHSILYWLVNQVQPEVKAGEKPIRVHASESVFALSNPNPQLVSVRGDLTEDYQDAARSRMLLQRMMSWTEERNLYPNQPLVGLFNNTNKRFGHLCANLGEWCQFWGIPPTESTQAVAQFADNDILANLATKIHALTPADFRLVKGSPGQGVLPGGKDLGADVDKVGPGKPYEEWKKTPDYKEWQKKTSQMMAAATQPFVVLARAGRAEESFPTLRDAVEKAHSGDTIEIRGNGPFLTNPLNLHKKALTLRAGDSFRPNLKYQPTDPKSKDPLLQTQAPLVLEGLILERAGNPEEKGWEETSIVTTSRAPLLATHCRLVGIKIVVALRLEQSPFASVQNSEILGNSALYHGIAYVPASSSRLSLENNLIVARFHGLRFSQYSLDLNKSQITLRRNTVLNSGPLTFDMGASLQQLAAGAGPQLPGLALECTGNILTGSSAFQFKAYHNAVPVETAGPLLPKLISFQDQQNLYALWGKFLLAVNRTGVPKALTSLQSVAEWEQFWGITKSSSQVGTPVYQGGDVFARAPDQLTPADFRLARGSPGQGMLPGGKDVGADVDKVGPDKPYEEWKKSPEYQEWLKKTEKWLRSPQDPYGELTGLTLLKAEDKRDVESTPPPKGAVVLFDGKGLTNWTGTDGAAPAWKVKDGVAEVNGPHHIISKQTFSGRFRVHVEFRVPYMPQASGQGRGNSGVYLQGRYEVQVLDSYGLKSQANDCGAIYGVAAPLVNACKAPTVWQSYDIDFTAPVFKDGKKVEPARMTVRHNGVLIHDDVAVPVDSTLGGLGGDPSQPGPLMLQSHGSPVQFRNVWVLPTEAVARAQPFAVLARAGRPEQAFATLKDAVTAAQGGDTIEIRGNGPFVMPRLELGKKALRIQAGAGFRPRLTQSLDDPGLENHAFIFTNAALVLEGLTIERLVNGNTAKEYPSLVYTWQGSVHVSHCRFVARGRTGGITAYHSVGGTVLNSEFQGNLAGAVGWNLSLRGEFIMENCVAVANWSCLALIQNDAELRNVVVRVRRNTFVGKAVLPYGIYGPPQPFIDKRPDPKVPELHLEIAENVIDATLSPWHVSEKKKYMELADYTKLLPRLFTLKDERNVYSHPGKPFLSLASFEQEWINPIANLDGWNKLWGITKPTSLVGDVRFVGGDLRKKGHEGQLVPADFRLATGSPGQGVFAWQKDLGADVDKVGPGAPYERWRQSPEYQEWRKSIEKLLSGQ